MESTEASSSDNASTVVRHTPITTVPASYPIAPHTLDERPPDVQQPRAQ
ncbi:hypothetical protein DAD186_02060 [Dermabacter vaginalis]|uniref:Uncharacterized protein n=1 Tax=Dermabacter vaginalis TaxID=1630135 RepID=A0A1B0ZFN3_9MICO|nr:hypothetical protein DAD186_02060 [Dermabacter vaginalis]